MSEFPEETGRPLRAPQKIHFDTRSFSNPFEHGRVCFLIGRLFPHNPSTVMRKVQAAMGAQELTFEGLRDVHPLGVHLEAFDPKLDLHVDPTMQLPAMMSKPERTPPIARLLKLHQAYDETPVGVVAQRKGIPSGLVFHTKPVTQHYWKIVKDGLPDIYLQRFCDFVEELKSVF